MEGPRYPQDVKKKAPEVRSGSIFRRNFSPIFSDFFMSAGLVWVIAAGDHSLTSRKTLPNAPRCWLYARVCGSSWWFWLCG